MGNTTRYNFGGFGIIRATQKIGHPDRATTGPEVGVRPPCPCIEPSDLEFVAALKAHHCANLPLGVGIHGPSVRDAGRTARRTGRPTRTAAVATGPRRAPARHPPSPRHVTGRPPLRNLTAAAVLIGLGTNTPQDAHSTPEERPRVHADVFDILVGG